MSTVTRREAYRIEGDRQELVDRLSRAITRDGAAEPQPQVNLSRFTRPTELHHGFFDPCFCVIAQGAKTISLAGEEFRYDPAHYMIATVGVPITAQVVEASPNRPYLSLRLSLDPAVVASVMVEAGLVQPRGDGGGVRAVDVSRLDADLLETTLRLVRLLDRPDQFRVLSPLVIREIVYRLLAGEQAGRMRHLASVGGLAHRMVRAVAKLRENFDKPLRIESIAKELGMSLSGFHAHFKAVTAMSPLQYQKTLRLQEARRLMIGEHFDASEAGYKVGYEDASQFNREYKRHFGEPPMRDVDRMRDLSTA